MFCSNCGNTIEDKTVPCPHCGYVKPAVIRHTDVNYTTLTGASHSPVPTPDPDRMVLHLKAPTPEPRYKYGAPSVPMSPYETRSPAVVSRPPVPSAHTQALASSSLRFGILGLALGTVFGIIFGLLAINRSNDCLYLDGCLSGQARAGRILGKIAFPLGIAQSVFLFFYFILIIEALS